MLSDAIRRIMLPTSRQKRPITAPQGSPQHNSLCNILSPERDLCPRGLELDRSTLADWVDQVAWLLDRWWRRSASMSSRRRRTTAMTPRFRSSRRGSGGPQPDGFGPMCGNRPVSRAFRCGGVRS